MSREQDYEGYKWIKVPRHVDDKLKPMWERFDAFEKHHIEETTFLIEEIRKLAREIDDLCFAVAVLRGEAPG